MMDEVTTYEQRPNIVMELFPYPCEALEDSASGDISSYLSADLESDPPSDCGSSDCGSSDCGSSDCGSPQQIDVILDVDTVSESKSIVQPLQPEFQQESEFANRFLLFLNASVYEHGSILLPSIPQQKSTRSKEYGTAKRDKRFICSICGKGYTTKYHYSMHLNIHSETYYPCVEPGCEKKFTHKKYLSAHKKKHNRTDLHICSFCGKKLTDWRNLKNHSASFHGVTLERKPSPKKAAIQIACLSLPVNNC
jgi:uncharacterized Zn-finger protein